MIPRELCRPEKCVKPYITAKRHFYESTLGNAACQWLGLIAMLIENKAPVVGRFMAAVTKEDVEGWKHTPFRKLVAVLK